MKNKLIKPGSRAGLAANRFHWHEYRERTYIGYRRKNGKGTVVRGIARYFLSPMGDTPKRTLGRSDDVQDADGIAVLSFSQRPRSWRSDSCRFHEQEPAREAGGAPFGTYRVAEKLWRIILNW